MRLFYEILGKANQAHKSMEIDEISDIDKRKNDMKTIKFYIRTYEVVFFFVIISCLIL